MDKIELVRQIVVANEAFRADKPFLTDTEYDSLWQALYAIDPDNPVLYNTTRDPTIRSDFVQHPRIIKGLQKAFKTRELKPFLNRFKDDVLIVEPKYDGVSALIYPYKNSYRLVLTGDGICGKDISRHIPNIKNIKFNTSFQQGEIIITKDEWSDSLGKNPRSFVSGCINSNKINHNLLTFINYNESEHYTLQYKNFDEVKITKDLLGYYNIWNRIYPIDGLVIKLANQELRLLRDRSKHIYEWSIAWKPPIQIKTSTITDITWEVSRHGRIIPVISYKNIELCGTNNTKATGNNAFWLTKKDLKVGDEVIVGKAGEIIPVILNEDKEIDLETWIFNPTLPVICPFCYCYLTFELNDLVCKAKDCLTQHIKRLNYFYSEHGMDVKGIGPKIIAKILTDDGLKAILLEKPYDLLNFYKYKDQLTNIIGVEVTKNINEEINKVSGKKTFLHFISGLGYKGLGYKTALRIYEYAKTGNIDRSVNPNIVENYIEAYGVYEKFIKEPIDFEFGKVEIEKAKKKFCITGTLSITREDMIEFCKKYNFTFVNQVSRYVDFLITGENCGRNKIQRAEELNIPMYTEEEVYKLLKDNYEKERI